MKKIKVSEASNQALNWLVAKGEGIKVELWNNNNPSCEMCVVFPHPPRAYPSFYDPVSHNHQGGPIIDDALISTGPIFVEGKFDCWEAFGHNLEYDDNGEFIEGSDHRMLGPTRLIAGLRCWVVNKLGYEVEVPEELLNG